ncbi:Nitroreductase [Thermodesulfobium acidiphilum]|uniref:Nitroreductase n=1 Tax=Thermodesulfobium acidiphilum TaxID=1794699 RepID=A0A2R4W2Q2_THEAF|nr:nitroreductase [Thermodesulfobium acidiphilum]AWB11053.1 Nitroreductase [Thermodesulfobium acidiphilum]
MSILEIIKSRRSVRKYKDKNVEPEKIDRLIEAAIWAPSAMNSQPWAFTVIQDRSTLKVLSDNSKKFLIENMNKFKVLEKYKSMLEKDDYNIFYNAPALITIYAKSYGLYPKEDCALAAENLMLEAHAIGLGTCWIGFAREYMDLEETKTKFNVPLDYSVVAPIIVGYPEILPAHGTRNSPIILYRK